MVSVIRYITYTSCRLVRVDGRPPTGRALIRALSSQLSLALSPSFIIVGDCWFFVACGLWVIKEERGDQTRTALGVVRAHRQPSDIEKLVQSSF
jgi:hypothetical protein